LVILAQFDCYHFADLHAAILDRGLACPEATAVFETNRDFGTGLLKVTINEVGGKNGGNHGNGPDDGKVPSPLFHVCLGQVGRTFRVIL
jgi:hypothetical protein